MRPIDALVLTTSVTSGGLAYGATMHAPTACEAPRWLEDIVSGLESCQCVDFTGDGIADDIALGDRAQVESRRRGTPLGDEWRVTSDRHVVVKGPRWYTEGLGEDRAREMLEHLSAVLSTQGHSPRAG